MEKGANSVYITENFIKLGSEPLTQVNISSLSRGQIVEKLKALFKDKRIMGEHFVLGIPRTRVAVKYLTLPAHDEREIAKITEYELNNLFPYKSDELIYDYSVINKLPDGYSQVMLVVAPKEAILEQTHTLSLAGLTPESINLSTVSLFNQFTSRKRPADDCLLINLDDSFLEILLINNGRLSFSRGITLKASIRTEDLLRIARENITIIKNKGSAFNTIVLSGRGQDLKAFARALEEIAPHKIEIDDSLSVSSGLTAQSAGLKINLLPQEFKARRLRNKIKSRNLLFISLLFLNLSLCANIVFQKVRLRQEYLVFIDAEIRKIGPQTHALREKELKARLVKISINSTRLTLSLLDELYRLAPEGISLNALTISHQKPPGVMTLAGQAGDSESVLRFVNALKESTMIKSADVSNISRLKAARDEGAVSFGIRVSLE